MSSKHATSPLSTNLHSEKLAYDQLDVDDDEPVLKYRQIAELPPSVFKDPISACLSTDTFLVFGTHSGVVHVTGLDFSIIRTYRAHNASVLGLSSDGIYVGSASLDGTVAMVSIQDKDDTIAKDFGRPVHSIALDPDYHISKAFISGGTAGKVVLSEKGWMGNRSDTILDSSEDTIVGLYWIEAVIIWMNSNGISVYGRHNRQLLLNLPVPEGGEGCRPKVCVPERGRLYIAWASKVWNLRLEVTKRETRSLLSSSASMVFSGASSFRSIPMDQTVILESEFDVGSIISGIGHFREDTMIILCYDESHRPLLKLLDSEGKITYSDQLPLEANRRLGPNDYHLLQYTENNSSKYFIVSANEAFTAEERDLGDKISWLVEKGKLEEAWQLSANYGSSLERYTIGIKLIHNLIDKDMWTTAGAKLSDVQMAYSSSDSNENQTIQKSASISENWTTLAWQFIDSDHLEDIAAYLPTHTDVQLDKKIYDTILIHMVDEENIDLLIKFLTSWDFDLYNFNMVCPYIEDLLRQKPKMENLRRSLISLYLISKQPLKAAHHLLHLKDPQLLDIIQKYNLFHDMMEDIPQIITLSFRSKDALLMSPIPIIKEAISIPITMIVKARYEVSPHDVVDKLQQQEMEIIIYIYLEYLSNVDPELSSAFNDLKVKLYAVYERPKLMPFLKTAIYDYDYATQVCESRKYIPELVYIYSQTGRARKALSLLTHEIGDIKEAIDFSKRFDEPELWDDLLDYCVENPQYIEALAERAAGFLEPAMVVMRLPQNTSIPNLKQILLNVFSEKNRMHIIQSEILSIVKNEAMEIADGLQALRTFGTKIDPVHSNIFAESVIVLPDGTMITESELLGNPTPWPPNFGSKLVGHKVRHLAYIKQKLNALLMAT